MEVGKVDVGKRIGRSDLVIIQEYALSAPGARAAVHHLGMVAAAAEVADPAEAAAQGAGNASISEDEITACRCNPVAIRGRVIQEVEGTAKGQSPAYIGAIAVIRRKAGARAGAVAELEIGNTRKGQVAGDGVGADGVARSPVRTGVHRDSFSAADVQGSRAADRLAGEEVEAALGR